MNAFENFFHSFMYVQLCPMSRYLDLDPAFTLAAELLRRRDCETDSLDLVSSERQLDLGIVLSTSLQIFDVVLENVDNFGLLDVETRTECQLGPQNNLTS